MADKTLAQLVRVYGETRISRLDDVARDQAGLLRDEIIEGWPVDTGASRAGWQGPTKVGEAQYRLRNDYDYAPTIEYGGYPGVGPKTEVVSAHVLPGGISVNAGIYPSQRPAAPVRRAISKRTVPFHEAIAKVLRQS
jgi:hypothetical protein